MSKIKVGDYVQEIREDKEPNPIMFVVRVLEDGLYRCLWRYAGSDHTVKLGDKDLIKRDFYKLQILFKRYGRKSSSQGHFSGMKKDTLSKSFADDAARCMNGFYIVVEGLNGDGSDENNQSRLKHLFSKYGDSCYARGYYNAKEDYENAVASSNKTAVVEREFDDLVEKMKKEGEAHVN